MIVTGTALGKVGFTLRLRCQRHLPILEPKVGIWPAGQPHPLAAVTWQQTRTRSPLGEFATSEILNVEREATIRLVWRGDVPPEFAVVLTGDIDAAMVTSETLGAACAVSIKPESQPKCRVDVLR